MSYLIFIVTDNASGGNWINRPVPFGFLVGVEGTWWNAGKSTPWARQRSKWQSLSQKSWTGPD